MASPAPKFRIGSQDGHLQLIRRGLVRSYRQDWYHYLLKMSPLGLLGVTTVVYLLANTLFALAYLLQTDALYNARPGSFEDAFFFSVQTMATIGYGSMYPQTVYANLLVTIEALIGLVGVAVVTGLMFARISRPTARILFSRVAVVRRYDGVPMLMFRAANQRLNQIVEAQARLTLVRSEFSADGEFMRRFYDLNLMRSMSPVFTASWTLMHAIDAHSPLFGATPTTLAHSEVELVVTMTGIDETFSQNIYARHSYLFDEILWNKRLADVLQRGSDGKRSIDYRLFHDVIPVVERDQLEIG